MAGARAGTGPNPPEEMLADRLEIARHAALEEDFARNDVEDVVFLTCYVSSRTCCGQDPRDMELRGLLAEPGRREGRGYPRSVGSRLSG